MVATYGVLLIHRAERLTSIICGRSAVRPVRAAGSYSTGISSHALTCAGRLKKADCTSLWYFEWQPLSVGDCVSVGGAQLVVLFGAESEPFPLVLRGVLESSVTYTTDSRSVGQSVLVSSPPPADNDISFSVVGITARLSASGRRL